MPDGIRQDWFAPPSNGTGKSVRKTQSNQPKGMPAAQLYIASLQERAMASAAGVFSTGDDT